MLTVHLHNVRFYGFHGIHAEEQLTGNEFEINLDVSFPENQAKLDDISATVNYSQLFALVKQRMMQPTALLEQLAGDIINEIHGSFPFVKRIKISIFKLQAAIPYLDGKVGISLERIFNE
ncbi:MAG TPA: dihydroneopterin aldolase [Flavitalea sp.]|nr:dihydroneopterin aldolase [Flavitalea sp.]